MPRRWFHRFFCLLLAFGATVGPMAFATSAEDVAPTVAEELEQLKRRIAELERGQAEAAVEPASSSTVSDALQTAVHLETLETNDLAPPADDLRMTARWNNGLELSTADKAFRVHVGGRTQLDVGWFSVDSNVNQHINVPYADGIDLRRARLRIDGAMYDQIEWAVEYDFVNSLRIRNQPGHPGFTDEAVTAPTDVWWLFKDLPWLGNVKVGHQKEPIGFEHMVSSRFLPFMERSFNQDAFYGGLFNGFTTGITAFDNYGDDDQGLIHVGLFKPLGSVFATNTGDGDFSVVGRITRLVWYVDDGWSLLHLGLSGKQATGVSQNGVAGRMVTFRTRDAIRTGLSQQWPVPAGINLHGDDLQQVNAELAGVLGPLTFQAEYLVSGFQDARRNFADAPLGTAVYHGGYLQLLYFLTGEQDHYSKQTAVFERVTPHENFFRRRGADGCVESGRGAWQVGFRYDYLDLNSGGLDGGVLHNYTTGLNWFLNPNMKIQFNYTATQRDAALAGTLGDGWIHGWGIRVAHDF